MKSKFACLVTGILSLAPSVLSAKKPNVLFLMSDDLNMKALRGTLAERTRGAQQAGCDLALHCSGDLDEMRSVADALVPASESSNARMTAALDCLALPKPMDRTLIEAERDALLRELEA